VDVVNTTTMIHKGVYCGRDDRESKSRLRVSEKI